MKVLVRKISRRSERRIWMRTRKRIWWWWRKTTYFI
jgi:hypothetical protein